MHRYDMGARTPLMIHVKEKSLKAILRDGKAIHLSYEPQEIRDLILAQVDTLFYTKLLVVVEGIL